MSRCILCGHFHAPAATCIMRRRPQRPEITHSSIASAESWEATTERILQRDGHTCQMCGSQPNRHDLRVDHVVPLSRLRSPHNRVRASSDENLRTLCRACYEWKTNYQRRW